MVTSLSDITKGTVSAFTTCNAASGIVNFGSINATQNSNATVTIPATWVTNYTILVCSPAAIATADHDPDDYVVEGITAYATNIQSGTSFDVVASAPNNTWGQYIVNVLGV